MLALEVAASATGPAGAAAVPAPLQGTIVAIDVAEGDLVRPGQQIAVLESMKMEHLVTAPHGGRVMQIAADVGATLMQDEAILYLEPAEIDAHDIVEEEDVDLDHIRPDLAELIERHAITLDENRPASVERRRKTNQRTARENVADLVDDGSFVEYGSLAIAAQRRRRKVDDLIRNTPADGCRSPVTARWDARGIPQHAYVRRAGIARDLDTLRFYERRHAVGSANRGTEVRRITRARAGACVSASDGLAHSPPAELKGVQSFGAKPYAVQAFHIIAMPEFWGRGSKPRIE